MGKIEYPFGDLAQIGDEVLNAVRTERRSQDAKWGISRMVTDTPEHWLTILGEEFGEVARAILDGEVDNYQTELIQVAAVAVAAATSYGLQRSIDAVPVS